MSREDQELKQRFRENQENMSIMKKIKEILATRECNQDMLDLFTALLPAKALTFRLCQCENWGNLQDLLAPKENEELLKASDVGNTLSQTASRLRKEKKNWKAERDTKIKQWLQPAGLTWEIDKEPEDQKTANLNEKDL